MREQVQLWRERGGEVKDPTGLTSFSVCNDSILRPAGSDTSDVEVIDLCPPCSLHLKLGVNEALAHLDKQMDENQLKIFLKGLNIEYEPYFGGRTLEGKEVSKVLKNVNLLEEIISPTYKPFTNFLHAYAAVVKSQFQVSLQDSWQEDTNNFGVRLAELQKAFPSVRMTPKWHIILNHVPEWLMRNNRGLGQVSEQEVEDTHSQFEKVWAKYRVKSVLNPIYINNYYRAVTDHNTTNLGEILSEV